ARAGAHALLAAAAGIGVATAAVAALAAVVARDGREPVVLSIDLALIVGAQLALRRRLLAHLLRAFVAVALAAGERLLALLVQCLLEVVAGDPLLGEDGVAGAHALLRRGLRACVGGRALGLLALHELAEVLGALLLLRVEPLLVLPGLGLLG